MNILQLLFSFKGRIGRKLFWIGILIPICVLASIVKYIPVHYSFDGITEVCFYVLIAVIGLAGLTKRLHDTGNSGLLVLACIIPASITWAISILYNSPPWLFILGYISFLIGLWISIKAMISSGTYGPNKFAENMDSFSFNRIAWLSNIMRKREPGHVENQ